MAALDIGAKWHVVLRIRVESISQQQRKETSVITVQP